MPSVVLNALCVLTYQSQISLQPYEVGTIVIPMFYQWWNWGTRTKSFAQCTQLENGGTVTKSSCGNGLQVGTCLACSRTRKSGMAKCGEGEECGRTSCSWWKPGHVGPWEKFRFSSKYGGKPAAGLKEECEVWDLSGYETGRKGSRGKQSSWDSLVTKQWR